MKRARIILTEFVLALMLSGVVVGLLFTGYYATLRRQIRLEQIKDNVLAVERLRLRLEQVFRGMITFQEVSHNIFSLSYRTDPERMERDPMLRGELQATLRLEDRRLILISWSSEGHSRAELLYEPVDRFECLLFHSKEGKFLHERPQAPSTMAKVILHTEPQQSVEIPLFL